MSEEEALVDVEFPLQTRFYGVGPLLDRLRAHCEKATIVFLYALAGRN